jgi:hypothetical protein
MMDSTDMSTPVTRGELQDALGLFQRELKQELTLERQQEIQTAVAPLATKAELHQEIQTAIAPLATRAELHQEIQTAIAPLATRAELHQEIQAAVAPLATKAELHQEIQAAVAPLATKAEIAPLATRAEQELWGGALVARMQHGEQRIDRLDHQFQQFEHRFLTELARHTSAILEAMRTEIKACIEPLADLPGRMARVEAAVFGPGPGTRRTRRRKH